MKANALTLKKEPGLCFRGDKMKKALTVLLIVALSVTIGFLVSVILKKTGDYQTEINDLKVQLSMIKESETILNKEIENMKARHEQAVNEKDAKIDKLKRDSEAVKVSSMEQIKRIREAVNKSWEQRFNDIEQEYFTALVKIRKQDLVILSQDEMILELKGQCKEWEELDIIRRQNIQRAIADLRKSIDLNETQNNDNAKLKKKLTFWRIIGVVAGGTVAALVVGK